MTVQKLIEILTAIEDKTMQVVTSTHGIGAELEEEFIHIEKLNKPKGVNEYHVRLRTLDGCPSEKVKVVNINNPRF